MKQSAWNYVLFTGLATVALSAAFAAGYLTHERVNPGGGSAYPVLRQVQALVRDNYLGDLPAPAALEYGAAHGLVGAVGDPYTRFVEPPAHELESNQLQGAFGGIGAELRFTPAGEVVLSPYPDGPAARAGILEGDFLLAVDGTAVAAPMTLDEISALIRGQVNSEVSLTVRTGQADERTVRAVRQEFEIPSVTWRQVDGQPQIGLVAVSRFSDKTAAELRRGYDDLRGRGITHLILDLRDNSGGLLDSSVEVASAFLDGGVVAFEQKRQGGERRLTANGGAYAANIPLAVLVNHGTASAAEIVAGALRDRGRAPLIGETTYGKGSVQLIFDLPDGSSVHVTAARWYTPLRATIDGQGLTPTLEAAARTDTTDPALDRALEYFLNGN
jgi:carboxyl-terminal processing protease